MTLPAIHPDMPIDPEANPEGSRCARALVQRVRWETGLSQQHFAATFALDAETLCDVEAGRILPCAELLAYLSVIEWAPDVVVQALRRSERA